MSLHISPWDFYSCTINLRMRFTLYVLNDFDILLKLPVLAFATIFNIKYYTVLKRYTYISGDIFPKQNLAVQDRNSPWLQIILTEVQFAAYNNSDEMTFTVKNTVLVKSTVYNDHKVAKTVQYRYSIIIGWGLHRLNITTNIILAYFSTIKKLKQKYKLKDL